MQTCCALNPIHHKRMSSMKPTDLPSLNHLRAVAAPAGAQPFHVGILIGPGFVPMDMVGVQTVLGLMPGSKFTSCGKPAIWSRASQLVDHADDNLCRLSRTARRVGDPDAGARGPERSRGRRLRRRQGEDRGSNHRDLQRVLLLGAAGILKGRKVTASHNALPILDALGVGEIVPAGHGVTIDGNLYTAGPGVGSFEAAFLVVEAAFGRTAAELAEVIIEYDPHPLYGMGVPAKAAPALVAQFEAIMEPLVIDYRKGSIESFEALGS
jgi:cyclohexyl-isocyanide hydratase